MKKRCKNTLESQRALYFAMFGECCPKEESFSLEDIEDSIAECKNMLDYAIENSDKKEISYWRKMLQERKVQRREILST